MKPLILSISLLCASTLAFAQDVYTIKADSTKLTGCDSNELIIENHTQGVPGFLYNTGNGRTAFQRPVTKLDDTTYLIGSDTIHLRFPTAWVQGGNAFGTTGKFGTLDNQNLDFYTHNSMGARLDTLGSLLLGIGSNSGYKLDVNGVSRVIGGFDASVLDAYDIRLVPGYVNGFAPGIDGSLILFGSIQAYVGVNKQDLGAIPANSLLVGGTSPDRVTTMVDYSLNPVFVVNGNGKTTINGGYSGILYGDTGTTANQSSPTFNINGGVGTGNGTSGDIIFSTGNAQASGTTIHTLTNRWWLKGGNGYLSNTSTPTSTIDITGDNGYSQLRMRTTYTPSSTSDTNGNVGDFSWDDNYLYIKTSAGWKRSALSTF